MCTNPLHILNPKKFLKINSGQQLYVDVPCGSCVECRKQRQIEWRVRTYYECHDTFNSTGRNKYVLFDTLTYSESYLPHLSDYTDVPKDLDFSCFSHSDIRKFNVDLNHRLNKLGYNTKGKLRYFYVCEYGSLKYTARPHYHYLFFVKDIPFDVLSYAISDVWFKGRTDGIRYRGRSYVRNHNLFTSIDSSQRRVIDYVTKYVTKDFLFNDLVKDRLYRLMVSKFPNFDYTFTDPEMRKYYTTLKRDVCPFHNQSKEYGALFYKTHNINDLIKNGCFKYVGAKGQNLVIGLFPSMKRKLFYNYSRENGSVVWSLNDYGIQFKKASSLRNFERLSKTFSLKGISKTNVFDYLFNQNRLLDKKIESFQELNRYIEDNSNINSLGYNIYRNYASKDISFIHLPVFTTNDFGSLKDGFKKHNTIQYSKKYQELTFVHLKDFEKNMYFDSNIDKIQFEYVQERNLEGKDLEAVERLKVRIKSIHKKLKYANNQCIQS